MLIHSFSPCFYRMATKDLQMYAPLFNGTNYQVWKDGLDAFTKAMKCYPPIKNDPPVVSTNNATQATIDKFNEIDQQVQGIIQLHIGASYKSHLKATAKLTIAELKMVFRTPGHIGALVELCSLFQHCIKPGASPVHEANNLIECSNCLVLAGFQLNKRLDTMAIFMALPQDWEQLIAYICSTTEDANFTLTKITMQIQHKYKCHQAGKGKSTIPLECPQNYNQRTTLFEDENPTLLSCLMNMKPVNKPSFTPHPSVKRNLGVNTTSILISPSRAVVKIIFLASSVLLVIRKSSTIRKVPRCVVHLLLSALQVWDTSSSLVIVEEQEIMAKEEDT